MIRRLLFVAIAVVALALSTAAADSSNGERHFLYVAEPGVRNYVEYGGIGVIVYDMDNGHKFVRRIPTFPAVAGQEPENVKGVAASAKTGRLYVSTFKRVAAIDLATDKLLWNKEYEGGADRLAVSPDGKTLYVPSLEGPHWHVVDAMTGDVIAKIITNSGAHNTIYGPDGRLVYLAGLHSPLLSIADAQSHKVVKQVGPFGNVIRPFTINAAQTLCFVNVNDLLGFEVGDMNTGKLLHRVEAQHALDHVHRQLLGQDGEYLARMLGRDLAEPAGAKKRGPPAIAREERAVRARCAWEGSSDEIIERAEHEL